MPAASGSTVARVDRPWTTLYKDSLVDRQELVRLVLQTLKDVGYAESAVTLENESGYRFESPSVAAFRQSVLDGQWDSLENLLIDLNVTDDHDIRAANFLISQQKYLELLESRQTGIALQVLRNELAPLNYDSDRLHILSSLIMCSSPDDLLQRAQWDGTGGRSRHRLLEDLQQFIPPSVMIPPRRLEGLLEQARTFQRIACPYYNSRTPQSLYSDPQCDKSQFPSLTTHILAMHGDEVWHLAWSHDGQRLASASKDRSAIIWHIGPESAPGVRECVAEKVLRDHADPVSSIAWSPDDSILLTSCEKTVKLWDVKTGACMREEAAHTAIVSALVWLPDGSGFVSGGMDRRIIVWDCHGNQTRSWGLTSIRIFDLAVTPDGTKVVAVGMVPSPPISSSVASTPSRADDHTRMINGHGSVGTVSLRAERRITVYDFATQTELLAIPMTGELTSVKVSADSKFALTNHAPDEVHLWDLNTGRMVRKYMGQRQDKHVIRSCFGGVDGKFIASGSEDGSVYIWHRETGVLLEVLTGHGRGSVNSVAWNPQSERLFASCSDDWTIRIWEAPPPGYEGYSPSHNHSNSCEKSRRHTDPHDMLD